MGQTPYESVACEPKGIMDSTAQSYDFKSYCVLDLMKMTS